MEKTMQTISLKKNNIFIITLAIFAIAFCWQLFLTVGFDFFWEDYDAFHIYWEKSSEYQIFKDKYLPDSIQPSRFTLTLGIGKEFIKQFFAPRRLFKIEFESHSRADRPYQFLSWDLSKILFGNNVLLYRIFRSLIFAAITCLIFLIIQRTSLAFALFGAFLYMTSTEIWLLFFYAHTRPPYALFAVMLSVLLFLKLTEKDPIRLRDTLPYYFLILLTSNFAVLICHDGRYLALIFFLTILLFRIKELKYHIFPLCILFMMQIPVLGYVKSLFTSGDLSPINFATHGGSSSSIFESLRIALINYKHGRNATGSFILTILYIAIATHLVYFVYSFVTRKKNAALKNTESTLKRNHKERLFLFFLWFLATFTMSAIARKFRYDGPFNIQLSDLSFFIGPFIILSCYYVFLVSARLKKKYRTIFLSLCLCFFSVQIVHNLERLNNARGGWGNFFIACQNAKKYVDKTSDNALVLAFSVKHHKPFLFTESNNKIKKTQGSPKTNPFSDLEFIEEKFEEGFDDVFVTTKMNEIEFRGTSENVILKDTLRIDGDSGDLYDRLKRFIGRPSKPMRYLYHFKYKK